MKMKPEERQKHILSLIKKSPITFEKIQDSLENIGNPIKERQLYNDLKILKESGGVGRGIPIKLNDKKQYTIDKTSPSWHLDDIDENTKNTMPFLLSMLKPYEYIPAIEHLVSDLDKNHSVSSMRMDQMMVMHNKILTESQFGVQKSIMSAVYSILNNIKNNTVIEFNYTSVHSDRENKVDNMKLISVYPIQVRVFEGRFYLIAVPVKQEKDITQNDIKTYCIDEILNKRVDTAYDEDTEETINFNWKKLYNKLRIDDLYKQAIGIMLPVDKTTKPILIKRWFKGWAASYVDAVPLHHTQRILEKKGDQILVSLKVYNTTDLEYVFGRFREFSWDEME
jgi:hypothetical protein